MFHRLLIAVKVTIVVIAGTYLAVYVSEEFEDGDPGFRSMMIVFVAAIAGVVIFFRGLFRMQKMENQQGP